MNKIIINFTPTGMIPTKKMTPHVPISPQEIIADVKRAVDWDVNMVHLHARENDGTPTYKKEIYAQIIHGIREFAPDLVICVSLSGRNFTAFDQRTDVLDLKGDLKPDMGSLTLSSLNFNKTASVNGPQMIKDLAQKMLDSGIKPELEAFDTGMINYAKYLIKKGLLLKPYYFNLILGNIACAQANLLSLGCMINDLPEESIWSVGGVGDAQLPMNSVSIAMGGGVRVGLEDNIYWTPDREILARNEDLLRRIFVFCEEHDREPYTHKELRRLLKL